MKKIIYFLLAAAMILSTACKDKEEEEKPVPVTSVKMNKNALNLDRGESEKLTAEVFPVHASNQKITWSSNRDDVTVDQTGNVTVKIDATSTTATITAASQEDGSKTDQCVVTIPPPPDPTVPVESVAIDIDGDSFVDGDIILLLGDPEITLNAVVSPDDAGNNTVTWSSSDPLIASIDEATGKLTALSSGIATITVTTEDGGKTDEIKVLVPNDVNLLKNSGFDEPDDNNQATPPDDWQAVEKEWFSTYYKNHPLSAGGALLVDQQYVANPNRRGGGSVFFTLGDGQYVSDFMPISGDFVGWIQGCWTGGMYQEVDVDPGKTYWFSAAIGVALPPSWAAWTLMLEEYSLKVLSVSNTQQVYEEAILKCPDPNLNFQRRVQGTITVPAGVTQVRFQIDKPSFDGDIAFAEAPIMYIDDCQFREIPN